MTITNLRCRIGTSSLVWISRNPASIWLRPATWEIFSATPIGSELSPMLKAVPDLPSSQDETFSFVTASSACHYSSRNHAVVVNVTTLRRDCCLIVDRFEKNSWGDFHVSRNLET